MNLVDRIKEIERRIQTITRLLMNARRTYTLGLHHTQHEPGGGDEIAHHAQHEPGGADPVVIKLDDAATPDDNTDLNASISRHGLLQKLDGSTDNFLRGDGNWAIPAGGGGSDPWTYKKLTADFSTDQATPANVTGLNFTPAANKTYIIEGRFLLRTSNINYGPRVGSAGPAGLDDGVLAYGVATAVGGSSLLHLGAIGAEWVHAAGALPNTTESWPAWLTATLVVGASPSGDFQIRFRSELTGITVYMKKGSHIRYREI